MNPTAQVRLQAQAAAGEKRFSGVIDCFRQTVRKEGFLAFFKGASSPLVGCAAYSATLFLAYGQSSRTFADVPSPYRIACVGVTTGLAASFVEAPLELTKTKCQVQFHRVSGKAQVRTSLHEQAQAEAAPLYKSGVDCARQLVRRYGVLALYQGWTGQALRNMPGSTVYFGSYEFFRGKFADIEQVPPLARILLSGGLAGAVFWTAVYPLDVARTKLMADHAEKALRKYTGPFHALRSTLAVDGVRGLYAGFSACMMRAFPTNAACFIAYEYTRKALDVIW